jgi:hypothetical protein
MQDGSDWTMLNDDDEVIIVLWERLLKQYTLTLIITNTSSYCRRRKVMLPEIENRKFDVSAKATSKMYKSGCTN